MRAIGGTGVALINPLLFGSGGDCRSVTADCRSGGSMLWSALAGAGDQDKLVVERYCIRPGLSPDWLMMGRAPRESHANVKNQ